MCKGPTTDVSSPFEHCRALSSTRCPPILDVIAHRCTTVEQPISHLCSIRCSQKGCHHRHLKPSQTSSARGNHFQALWAAAMCLPLFELVHTTCRSSSLGCRDVPSIARNGTYDIQIKLSGMSRCPVRCLCAQSCTTAMHYSCNTAARSAVKGPRSGSRSPGCGDASVSWLVLWL